jgi:hypothetical protein
VNIDPKDMIEGFLEARSLGVRSRPPSDQVHSFNHLMMPALVRVGAITERTREQLAEHGIRISEDLTVLRAFEEQLDA